MAGEVLPEVGNLPNLVDLNINTNSLTGVIPYSVFNHSTIRSIVLYSNQLSGHLPSSIGNWLPNLEELYLWDNKLNGILIPSSISNASKLIILELEGNYFSGSIPHTLGNLRHLEVLNVAGNSLTRESATLELSFLSSLTNCRDLTRLMLANNPLNGTLPISIGNFSESLRYFSAFECNIKGTIPKQIGNLNNLLLLHLQDNELAGTYSDYCRRNEGATRFVSSGQ